MEQVKEKLAEPIKEDYYIRKLAKSGSSRYIAVGTILPKDWKVVKIYVKNLSSEGCLFKIVPIR